MIEKLLHRNARWLLQDPGSEKANATPGERLGDRLRGGLWVASGQIIAVLGVLVGVRLQTEVIRPEVYGEAVLYTGLSTLAMTIVGVPYSRGAMLFYGKAALLGIQEGLFDFVRKAVAKQLGLGIVALLVCGLAYVIIAGGSPLVVISLSALVAVDSARTVEMAFLSAKKQQRQYAMWSIMEAWSRPLLAVVAVLVMGVNVEVILVSYVLASMAALLCFMSGNNKPHQEYSEVKLGQITSLTDEVRKYSLPLMPQGLVGWFGALSDRYLLAAIVGLHESGIYSAIFGLVSRPFLLAQSVSELTIRPSYFQAVTTNNRVEEVGILQRWLLMNCAAGLVLMVGTIAGSDLITRYLLGEAYATGASMIPYLAVGHLFLILGYGLNGYLYAHQYTRQLFLFDLLAVLLSLSLSPIAMWNFGAIGAAGTCAVVFMTRTVGVGIFVYRKSHEPR